MSLITVGAPNYNQWLRDPDGSWLIPIQRYDSLHDSWKLLKLKAPIDSISCIAECNNQLYFKDDNNQRQLYRYDITNRIWDKLCPLTQEEDEKQFLSGAGHCFHQGYLYNIGGSLGNIKTLDKVRRWNPLSDTWEDVPSMVKARKYPEVTVLGERLFVAGGYTDTFPMSFTEFYNPSTQTWKRRADMSEKRYAFGLTSLNGCVYAVGGYQITENWRELEGRRVLNLVERYDVKLNKWTTLSPLNIPRCNLDVVAFEGSLWAIGGNFSPNLHNTVERYDVKKDQWTVMNPLKVGGSLKCLVLPTSIADCLANASS